MLHKHLPAFHVARGHDISSYPKQKGRRGLFHSSSAEMGRAHDETDMITCIWYDSEVRDKMEVNTALTCLKKTFHWSNSKFNLRWRILGFLKLIILRFSGHNYLKIYIFAYIIYCIYIILVFITNMSTAKILFLCLTNIWYTNKNICINFLLCIYVTNTVISWL